MSLTRFFAPTPEIVALLTKEQFQVFPFMIPDDLRGSSLKDRFQFSFGNPFCTLISILIHEFVLYQRKYNCSSTCYTQFGTILVRMVQKCNFSKAILAPLSSFRKSFLKVIFPLIVSLWFGQPNADSNPRRNSEEKRFSKNSFRSLNTIEY